MDSTPSMCKMVSCTQVYIRTVCIEVRCPGFNWYVCGCVYRVETRHSNVHKSSLCFEQYELHLTTCQFHVTQLPQPTFEPVPIPDVPTCYNIHMSELHNSICACVSSNECLYQLLLVVAVHCSIQHLLIWLQFQIIDSFRHLITSVEPSKYLSLYVID